MTINIKNFLKGKSQLSKMGEFQNLKKIEGMQKFYSEIICELEN